MEAGNSLNWYYNVWTPSTGNFYTINPNSLVYWGGDSANSICNCKLQYVRFYIGYAASTLGQMTNLALINPESKAQHMTNFVNFFFFPIGKLYLFQFVSDPMLNSNQTIAVSYLTDTATGVAAAVKGKPRIYITLLTA